MTYREVFIRVCELAGNEPFLIDVRTWRHSPGDVGTTWEVWLAEQKRRIVATTAEGLIDALSVGTNVPDIEVSL